MRIVHLLGYQHPGLCRSDKVGVRRHAILKKAWYDTGPTQSNFIVSMSILVARVMGGRIGRL